MAGPRPGAQIAAGRGARARLGGAAPGGSGEGPCRRVHGPGVAEGGGGGAAARGGEGGGGPGGRRGAGQARLSAAAAQLQRGPAPRSGSGKRRRRGRSREFLPGLEPGTFHAGPAAALARRHAPNPGFALGPNCHSRPPGARTLPGFVAPPPPLYVPHYVGRTPGRVLRPGLHSACTVGMCAGGGAGDAMLSSCAAFRCCLGG